MRIALTADVHLTTRKEHPGRLDALESVFQEAVMEEAELVVIAGDLFDAGRRTYGEFEALCGDPRFSALQILVIPGNHDANLSQRDIAAKNVAVITEPKLLELDHDRAALLLIPYKPQETMGEQISPLRETLKDRRWVLIGHGDWSEGVRAPNPYEPGVYMPLTRMDIDVYKPEKVLLGHVHLPLDLGAVHYPGSPYPLDVTEAGPRRLLLLDTETLQVEPRPVKTDVIYFDESLVVLPVEDEAGYVKDHIRRRVESWGLRAGDENKVRLRLKVVGYSSDRKALAEALDECLSGFQYYEDKPPDISTVLTSTDIDRKRIADETRISIEALDWPWGPREPSQDEVLLAALQLVYGGK